MLEMFAVTMYLASFSLNMIRKGRILYTDLLSDGDVGIEHLERMPIVEGRGGLGLFYAAALYISPLVLMFAVFGWIGLIVGIVSYAGLPVGLGILKRSMVVWIKRGIRLELAISRSDTSNGMRMNEHYYLLEKPSAAMEIAMTARAPQKGSRNPQVDTWYKRRFSKDFKPSISFRPLNRKLDTVLIFSYPIAVTAVLVINVLMIVMLQLLGQ